MVEVRVRRGGAEAGRFDLMLVGMPEGDPAAVLRGLRPEDAAALRRRVRAVGFRGRSDETLVHHGERSVVLLGLGPRPVGVEAWRRAGGRGRQEAERQRARRVGVRVGEDVAVDAVAAFVEAFQLAGYRFTSYASDPERRARVTTLALIGDGRAPAADLRRGLARVDGVVTEVARARDFVNEPASVATPTFLAERVEALSADIPGLEVDVWRPARIGKEGLVGLLAVARGSREEPRFISLRWQGAAQPRVVLVGKGITFDSGGLSLKPAKSMEQMKYDMAGGAAVIGAVAAAARLRVPIDVTGYVPATENLPGGRAQKPGDILRFLNGKTVDVRFRF